MNPFDVQVLDSWEGVVGFLAAVISMTLVEGFRRYLFKKIEFHFEEQAREREKQACPRCGYLPEPEDS